MKALRYEKSFLCGEKVESSTGEKEERDDDDDDYPGSSTELGLFQNRRREG